jgi:hypothetical protein
MKKFCRLFGFIAIEAVILAECDNGTTIDGLLPIAG